MKKVLVVDDNEEILNVISILLDMEGYKVKCQDTGLEIFDTVFSYAPDIILLDIMLGNSDGREICRELKSNPGTKHIPIIMISASHNINAVPGKECHAEDFIAKPFNIDHLVAKVGQYVNSN